MPFNLPDIASILGLSNLQGATYELRMLLESCLVGQRNAAALRAQWHRKYASVVIERIFGEGGSSLPLMPITNWMDAADGCFFELYEAAREQGDAAINAEFSRAEQSKCLAAIDLKRLFTPVSPDGTCPPDSLFKDEPRESYLLRRELLPLQLRRLLEAAGMGAPNVMEYDGGLCADPALLALQARTAAKLQQQLLPAKDPSGLRIPLRDLVLCLFCNYPVSRTLKRMTPVHYQKALDNSRTPQAGLPLASRQQHYTEKPLLHHHIGDLTTTHIYNQIVFEFMDMYLPTNVSVPNFPISSRPIVKDCDLTAALPPLSSPRFTCRNRFRRIRTATCSLRW
jgi:hypothetical protein